MAGFLNFSSEKQEVVCESADFDSKYRFSLATFKFGAVINVWLVQCSTKLVDDPDQHSISQNNHSIQLPELALANFG